MKLAAEARKLNEQETEVTQKVSSGYVKILVSASAVAAGVIVIFYSGGFAGKSLVIGGAKALGAAAPGA